MKLEPSFFLRSLFTANFVEILWRQTSERREGTALYNAGHVYTSHAMSMELFAIVSKDANVD